MARDENKCLTYVIFEIVCVCVHALRYEINHTPHNSFIHRGFVAMKVDLGIRLILTLEKKTSTTTHTLESVYKPFALNNLTWCSLELVLVH